MSKILGDRVVILIDMDCFYCQVEEKLNPELKGKPIAVVQYNQWKGGGIIAVNYVARAMGVTRHMRGDEAKEKCPDIMLPQVPCSRGKADTTKYRNAGKEVAKVLQSFTSLVERASVDEAYVDITQLVEVEMKSRHYTTILSSDLTDTYILGHENINEFVSILSPENETDLDFNVDLLHSQKLLVGAYVTNKIRSAILKETGYTSSAGISHNKILAKLICGMNKPNKQTLLPKYSVNLLYRTLDVNKVKGLGGKFGDAICETLKIKKMTELQKFTEKELQQHFEPKQGTWLFNIARGMDSDPVTPRYVAKSIGCCKNFRGKSAIQNVDTLLSWLSELGKEIEERLENDMLDNNRTPRQMVVSFSQELSPNNDVSSSRSYNFLSNDNLNSTLLSAKAMELIKHSTESSSSAAKKDLSKLTRPITFLGLSVGKFEDISDNKKTKSIQDLFNAQKEKLKHEPKSTTSHDIEDNIAIVKENDDRRSPVLSTAICLNTPTIIKSATLGDQESFFNKYFQKQYIDTDKAPAITPMPLQNKCLSKESFVDIPSSKVTQYIGMKQNTDDVPRNSDVKVALKNNQENDIRNDESAKEINSKTYTSTNILINSTIENIDELMSDNESNDSISSIGFEINSSKRIVDENALSSSERQNKFEQMRGLLSNSLHLDENQIDVYEEQPEEDLQTFNNMKLTFCKDCQQNVPENEFETHGDYHLALRLTEEEKSLGQNVIVKQNELIENKKLPKKENKKSKGQKSDSLPISNFFSKTHNNLPVNDVMENCKECGKNVPVKNFAEHLDFHEAQKLHHKINFEQKRKIELCNKNTKVARIECYFK